MRVLLWTSEYSPDVSSLPALESGRITFGSMHHLAKLNGQVLDLWCELLKALRRAPADGPAYTSG